MWLTNGGAKVQTLALRKHFSERTKTIFSKKKKKKKIQALSKNRK